MTRRQRLLLVLLACVSLAATGCVGIPDEGPIVETQSEADAGQQLGYYNDPRPPSPGESPTDIVQHFLDAQSALPIQTSTAEQFLTRDAAASWRPERRTIIYADASMPRGANQVTVELDGANQIDARGSWLGRLPRNEQELRFSMMRENGEWRIDDLPDALVVPESWFAQAYRRLALYFFDPSARIMVPEPVFVPRGDQMVSALVAGLTRGPGRGLREVERSFLPPGLKVDLSVPVTEDGVAEVNLTGDAPIPAPQDATKMAAQLAHTLSQDPSLTGLRIAIDGEPVTLTSGPDPLPMQLGDIYDPAAPGATSDLFGLRDGRLVAGPADDLTQAAGPMSETSYGLRAVAASLDGEQVAGVTSDGARVLVTQVHESDADVTTVAGGGTDQLPPQWDFAGRLWLLDRGDGAARVSVVQGGRLSDVRVPGVTGEDVSRFLVSRDGSRLVAVLDRGSRDRVVVSRIRYDARGRVRAGTPADRIFWDDLPRISVIDIGWSSPTSIVVMHRLSRDLAQVRTMSVDGAPAGLSGIATTVPQRPRALVSSPMPTDTIYAVNRAGLVDVSGGGRVVVPGLDVSYLTFAG